MRSVKKRLRAALALLAAPALLMSGCADGAPQTPEASGSAAASYTQITQQEAARIMEEESGFVILDVRTREEFAAGHIPGAICVPNESIADVPPAELPDKAQRILVYCRSGRRSKEAAQKLADMGYTAVMEFGGIIDWTGEVTTG